MAFSFSFSKLFGYFQTAFDALQLREQISDTDASMQDDLLLFIQTCLSHPDMCTMVTLIAVLLSIDEIHEPQAVLLDVVFPFYQTLMSTQLESAPASRCALMLNTMAHVFSW